MHLIFRLSLADLQLALLGTEIVTFLYSTPLANYQFIKIKLSICPKGPYDKYIDSIFFINYNKFKKLNIFLDPL